MIHLKTILDTRRKKGTEKATSLYPIKIRITCNRIQKYYSTGFKVTEGDFVEVMKPVPIKRLKSLKVQIEHLETKARTIINKLDAFSFRVFEENFYNAQVSAKSVYELYDKVIKEKQDAGKIGTAANYECSKNSLKNFISDLAFVDITPELLKKYERHLLSNGKSISTVGIYLRPLRAIYNEAIAIRIISKDYYPFGLRKYVIPASQNIKKALSKEDFIAIAKYQPQNEKSLEARSKDFWFLSYLCQGINPKDLLMLKKNDLDEKFIKFIRMKTKDTSRASIKEIVAPMLPEMKAIIERWKSDDVNSAFLFPFLNESMSPMQIYKTVHQFVKTTNKYMDAIAKSLGINKKVRCYTARFQFTKSMMDAGVSIHYIRECLGHNNILTTQRYLDSFENEMKYQIANKHLLDGIR